MSQKNDELQHYGVLGMKWGVRRSTKQLQNARTKEERDKAVTSLKKHREKASGEIAKRKAENEKLYEKRKKQDAYGAARAAQLSRKAAIQRGKSASFIRPSGLKDFNAARAKQLQSQADQITANIEATKAKIAENDDIIRMMETGIKDIDKALADKGKRYVKG